MELSDTQKQILVTAYALRREFPRHKLTFRNIRDHVHLSNIDEITTRSELFELNILHLISYNDKDTDDIGEFEIYLTEYGINTARRIQDTGIRPNWKPGVYPRSDLSLAFSDESEVFPPNVSRLLKGNNLRLDDEGTPYGLEIEPDVRDAVEVVQSEGWTGRPNYAVLEARQVQALQACLVDAERKIDSLNLPNSLATQAKAYVVAIRVLSETPDPPEKVIKELILLLAGIAGIGALFVELIKLGAGF